MSEFIRANEQLKKLQTDEEIDKYFQDQANFYLAKRKIETIDNFNGVFDFLNNEFPCEIYYEGRIYPSVFHASQAARSTKDHERAKIALAESMQELYELVTEIEDPEDWQLRRLVVMETCLRDKFRRHRELRERLRKTGNRELINSYSDRSSSNLFWGIVDGKGQNHLGNLLQSVRLDIHTEKELNKWLDCTMEPESDKYLLPRIKVEVFKQDSMIESQVLKKTPYNIFGSLPTCDFVLAHQSISRNHLSILVDKKMGVVIIDLGSKAGTFLNGERIKPHLPIVVKSGDWFGVGESTRTYYLRIDFNEVKDYLEKKHKSLTLDLKILSLQKDLDKKEDIVKAGMGLLKQDTIFASSLPDGTSEKEVRDSFSQFGKIVEVRIPIHPQTGKSKNIAFIKYSTEEEAKSAFKTVRLPMKDKLVKIQFAEKNKNQIVNDLEKEVKKELTKKEREVIEKDHKRRHKRERSRESSEKKRRSSHKEKKRERSNSRIKVKKRERSSSSSSDLSD